jgi:hypothetical protein
MINNATNLPSCTFSIKSNTATNVTGDGTVYKIVFANAVINEGSCFNTAAREFVAPAQGNYLIIVSVKFSAVASNQTSGNCVIYINGAPVYTVFNINPYAAKTGTAWFVPNSLMIIPLNQNDAVSFYLTVSGGAKTVSLSNVGYVYGMAI